MKMNSYNLSSIGRAKELYKIRLREEFPEHLSQLIADRKFSKLPFSLRFKTLNSPNFSNTYLLSHEIQKVNIKKKEVIRELVYVYFLILNLVIACVINKSRRTNFDQNISFIYSLTPDQIAKDRSTSRLEEFLKESRFGKLCEDSKIIIESKKLYKYFGNNKYGDIEIVYDSSIWIASNLLDRKTLIRLVFASIVESIKVLSRRRHENLFILRELIVESLIWKSCVERIYSINLITTQTHFLKLPYAFYLAKNPNITRTMIWYSTSSMPIENRNSHKIFDPEHFHLENIDTHYVWTSQHANFVSTYNPHSKVIAIGSILFQPKPEIATTGTKIDINTVVFDVTPFEGLNAEIFYTTEILTDFISDIVEIVGKERGNSGVARILLKPKRKYKKKSYAGISPSRLYMNYIYQLHLNNDLQLLDPETDLYQLISAASLVIGIPYTSPVTLAKEMNIECIYYVPDSARDWIFGKLHDDVPVIQGKKELSDFVKKLRQRS